MEGRERSPDNLELLRLGVGLAVKSAAVTEAKMLIEDWSRRSPDEPHEFAELVINLCASLDRGELREDVIQDIIGRMTSIQRK